MPLSSRLVDRGSRKRLPSDVMGVPVPLPFIIFVSLRETETELSATKHGEVRPK